MSMAVGYDKSAKKGYPINDIHHPDPDRAIFVWSQIDTGSVIWTMRGMLGTSGNVRQATDRDHIRCLD